MTTLTTAGIKFEIQTAFSAVSSETRYELVA